MIEIYFTVLFPGFFFQPRRRNALETTPFRTLFIQFVEHVTRYIYAYAGIRYARVPPRAQRDARGTRYARNFD